MTEEKHYPDRIGDLDVAWRPIKSSTTGQIIEIPYVLGSMGNLETILDTIITEDPPYSVKAISLNQMGLVICVNSPEYNAPPGVNHGELKQIARNTFPMCSFSASLEIEFRPGRVDCILVGTDLGILKDLFTIISNFKNRFPITMELHLTQFSLDEEGFPIPEKIHRIYNGPLYDYIWPETLDTEN